MKKTSLVKMLFFVMIVFLSACGPNTPNCSEEVLIDYKRDLRALVDTKNLEGTFFLGTGGIAGEYSYTFVEIIEDGGFYTREIPGDDAIVYEHEDSQKAWVVKKYSDNLACVPDNTVSVILGGTYWYELHIPSGSVVSLIELDLE